LKEDRFSDFSIDNSAKKLFNGKWKAHTQLLAAHKQAIENKHLGKKGEWLKKAFKSDVVPTQPPEEFESDEAADAGVTKAPPESFTFDTEPKKTKKGATPPRTGKKAVDDSESESSDTHEKSDSEELLSAASQRVQGTYFVCCFTYFFYTYTISLHTTDKGKQPPNKKAKTTHPAVTSVAAKKKAKKTPNKALGNTFLFVRCEHCNQTQTPKKPCKLEYPTIKIYRKYINGVLIQTSLQ
jgi:hypothetical protein